MRAIRVHGFGGIDTMQLHEIPRPAPKAGDVPVTLALGHGQARIGLGPGGDGAAAILLIGFDRRHVTAVKRGENSGRTLAHVDVVRGIEEIARSGAGEIAVPIRWPCDRVAAVVQAADGRVLGVAFRDAEPL